MMQQRPLPRLARTLVPLALGGLLAACTAFPRGNASTSGNALSVAADPVAAIAPTPPMGWNSWDCYGPTVTEKEVRANADYMAQNLKQFGWQYIIVDIRWYITNPSAGGYQRNPDYVVDANGRFQPAPNRFPSSEGGKGFKPLADYVHSKGLKFGVHLMRGIPQVSVERKLPIAGTNLTAADVAIRGNTASWLRDMWGVDMTKPGGQEWYDSLISMLADWGVDYIKVDDCSSPYYWREIEGLRKAIDKTGRPIVLSLSPGATPLNAGPHVNRNANLWRIQGDFWDLWRDLHKAFEDCANWAQYRRPGHWPDADMLPLGHIGIRAERGNDRQTRFTPEEQKTMMSLWSIFQSPLMFGGDLPSNDAATLALISNPEVLAVNQHAARGHQVSRDGERIVWMADAPNGRDRYIGLFNIGNSEAAVSANLAEIGFRGDCKIRDLWNHKDLGSFNGKFEQTLPPHGSGLYLVSDAAGNN